MAGSAPYMAPEQLRGQPGSASDQYALAVVVYEWLCGKRPFDGGTLELTKLHLLSLPPSLRRGSPPLARHRICRAACAGERAGQAVPFGARIRQRPIPCLARGHVFTSTRQAARISTDELPSYAPALSDAPQIPDVPDSRVYPVIAQESVLLEPVTDPTQPIEVETDSERRPVVVQADLLPDVQPAVQPAVQPGQLWNVPAIFTPLLGREQEVIATCALLMQPSVRLLTLLGTGGIGKTRLSIQLATETRPTFADGVCFVALAAIRDPEMVMPAILRALGLSQKDVPSFEQVKAFLQQKQLLLVLDNVEQVVAAAPQIAALLAACPTVKALATSRIALRIAGEQQVQLPPLPLPDISQLPGRTAIAQYASVMLFAQRAQALLPTFQVTAANAQAIAEICVRLDGLPLAIELAAARVKILPPPALLARLSNRLQVLTRGAATLPERQQTLRNTI